MTEPAESVLRRELVAQYKRVAELRLNELASGNLSVRCGDGMLISPGGASEDTITADSIVRVSAQGTWPQDQRPSSEWQMHFEIYRARPQAMAVVHTHSDYCVAVACHNMPLPGFHYLVGVFGGSDVPIVPYATFGSPELAHAAASALEHRSACLLANHGMIAYGANLTLAVAVAHRLEIMCRQYVLARQLGEPARLGESDWRELAEQMRRLKYG